MKRENMIIRHIFFWFVLMLVAIGNGLLREATYGKRVTELAAHQISTLTGILFTGLAVWVFSRIWPLKSLTHVWMVGLSWLLLTLIFEFSFGHYVAGHSWARLLQDYNLLAGRVWVVFLLWVAIMPYIFYKTGRTQA
ncbi:hypothetical protein [Sedimenticola selenatireducens]|nr:hypothetical protein [Sedimenticola selenatireducens]